MISLHILKTTVPTHLLVLFMRSSVQALNETRQYRNQSEKLKRAVIEMFISLKGHPKKSAVLFLSITDILIHPETDLLYKVF